MGIEPAASFELVEGVSELLEQDKPKEAQTFGLKTIDLTGAYLVFAFLSTGEENLPNSTVEFHGRLPSSLIERTEQNVASLSLTMRSFGCNILTKTTEIPS